MAPDGNIWFNPGFFVEDFSVDPDPDKKAHFVHEMTHVWQKQLGYPVARRGAIRVGLDYNYELSYEKNLSDYNMEAQGEIISDYFKLKHLNNTGSMRMKEYADKKWLPLYELVLRDFLKNPSNKKILHNNQWKREYYLHITQNDKIKDNISTILNDFIRLLDG